MKNEYYYDFPAPCPFGFHHEGQNGYYIATLRITIDDNPVVCYGHCEVFDTIKEAQSFLRKHRNRTACYHRHILIYPSKSAKFMSYILRLKCGSQDKWWK